MHCTVDIIYIFFRSIRYNICIYTYIHIHIHIYTYPYFTAEDYLGSFQAKVQTIRDDTAGSPPTFPSTTCSLSAVTAITPAELRHIIIAAAPKSCELDPLPTFLLQEHLDILLPLLTTICNRSILEGVLPPAKKRSILIPVIKREGLDPTDPGNFRPTANVTFISTAVE